MSLTLLQSFSAFGLTDRGLTRSTNDDSFFLASEMGVFAVADGLGGLPDGALASRTAVEVLQGMMAEAVAGQPLDLGWLFYTANDRVRREGHRVRAEVGIGTTLTVAQLLPGGILRVGHVGDSGIFALSGDSFVQLTDDHTMSRELRARLHPDEHAYIPEYFEHTLTRCVGQNEPMMADVFDYRMVPRERLLFYTDGVTKVFGHGELQKLVASARTPEELVRGLIEVGNERGGPDNITAVAVFFD